jgi:hypothetical protein
MAQVTSRRIITKKARIQSQASARGVLGGQSGNGAGSPPITYTLPCQYPFQQCSIVSHPNITVPSTDA